MNSDPWEYLIYVGLGYLVHPVVSTKFEIDISLFSSYFVLSKHPVTGSIMLTAFRSKFYFCPFLIMT